MITKYTLALILCIGSALLVNAKDGDTVDKKGTLSPVMVQPGEMVFECDFEEALDLKKAGISARQATRWSVENGLLVGIESTEEYQKKRTSHRGFEPRVNFQMCPAEYCVSFRVRFVGGKFSSLFPFFEWGHWISRLQLNDEKGMTLSLGVNEVNAAEVFDVRVKDGEWYEVIAELKDGELLVRFADGGPVLYAKHDILKNKAKSGGTGFGVAGSRSGRVEFDYIQIMSVGKDPNPNWEKFRDGLPKFDPKPMETPQKEIKKKK